MPDNSGRPKVGPADPATQRKALADYEKSASAENKSRKESAAARSPTKPASGKTATPSQTKSAAAGVKRSILEEIRDAIDEKIPRTGTHNGQTVEEAVDEAVNGATGVKPAYF